MQRKAIAIRRQVLACLAGLACVTGAGEASAQLGIVNQVINSAIQMQQQQQAIEGQRRAAERAATQQRQAEQKRQEADKASAEKQAKLARVVPVAEQLIEEVSAFIKRNPNDPKLLTFAEAVAELGKSLKSNDPAAIEKQTAKLNALVQKDTRFVEFATVRAEERREQNARELVEIVKQARMQRAFILGYISRNPTSPGVDVLLPLAKSLDDALQQPSYDTLKPLTLSGDIALRQAGLRSAFLNAQADLASEASTSAAPAAPAAPTARSADTAPSRDALRTSLTEKNRFLLDGSVDDVVFLYNASSEAPHVLKNLKGDIVFERSTASVCLFQKQADMAGASLARRILAAYGLDVISVDARGCAADKLRSVDVIMVRRSAMFREDTVYALALLQQIETGAFASLRTVTWEELAERTALAARRAEEVEGQSKAGFGLIVLANAAPTVCAVVSEDVPAHERILAENAQTIRAEINAAPQATVMSLDAAFAGVKRGRCAAVYADTANLKSLSEGLKRDGTAFQLLAFWVSPDQVIAARDRVNTAVAAAQTQSYERQRAMSEAAQIASVRAEEEARNKDVMRAKLRESHGKKAEAASSIIAGEVKSAIGGTDKSARDQYPAFFSWLDDKRRDRWEVFSVNAVVFDYGTVDWKGRRLELGAARTEIRIRNQMLGEYQDHCFIFAKVFDYEFQATRDFVVLPCGKEGQILAWKTSRDFRSLWDVP